ncbi:MAG: S26 family signal peptidase [Pseudonocardiaceae bacterium]
MGLGPRWRRRSWRWSPWRWGRWCCATVRGPSMSPTLVDGDLVLLSKRGRAFPGAIVVVGWAQRPGQLSVKRVVGRHGEGWWVLGDNPAGSTDSRQLGAAEPVAVVLARLWPVPRSLARRPLTWRPPPSTD